MFGSFLDSTLDRVADAAVLGGLAVFYATSTEHRSVSMIVVCIAGIVGAFLTSKNITGASRSVLAINDTGGNPTNVFTNGVDGFTASSVDFNFASPTTAPVLVYFPRGDSCRGCL